MSGWNKAHVYVPNVRKIKWLAVEAGLKKFICCHTTGPDDGNNNEKVIIIPRHIPNAFITFSNMPYTSRANTLFHHLSNCLFLYMEGYYLLLNGGST